MKLCTCALKQLPKVLYQTYHNLCLALQLLRLTTWPMSICVQVLMTIPYYDGTLLPYYCMVAQSCWEIFQLKASFKCFINIFYFYSTVCLGHEYLLSWPLMDPDMLKLGKCLFSTNGRFFANLCMALINWFLLSNKHAFLAIILFQSWCFIAYWGFSCCCCYYCFYHYYHYYQSCYYHYIVIITYYSILQ